MDEQKFREMADGFVLDRAALQGIATRFRCDIEAGLEQTGESSLRLLKSYIGLPTGEETGRYLAVDFGGTNVRAACLSLAGQGEFTVLKKVAKPLWATGTYDYVGAAATAEELFDFIAGLIEEAVAGDRATKYRLGHTFSFPSQQTNLYNAKLIGWTKEFAVQGVAGQVVNDLLKAALKRRGLQNVQPVAVINDTVAVLLAAAYKQQDTYIGSIYATGHNTCYLEPYAEQTKKPMILNLESGGFDKIETNYYDRVLDAASEKPGEQRLEKMVAGCYLGQLFSLCMADGLGMAGPYCFTSIDLSRILADSSAALMPTKQLVRCKTGCELSAADCALVKALAEAIVVRSGRIVAATYAGIIGHLNGTGVKQRHIAIDGSVYGNMPLVKDTVHKALGDLLGKDAANADLVFENGGSILGAALAAAAEPIA